jgi:hypothetical protein
VEAGRVPPDKARAFRNDARLVKTLILSSLAEGVEALKAITPARLAALNHGTVRTPIPGMESQMVLTKVRGWAARVGEIKVAEDARNPVISVHLVGVDTEGILENAKAFDNYGTRIQKVRALLYEMLGITQEESLLPPKHRMTWKGTQRETELLFRNVRELPLDNFEPQDAAWRIVIDYPFDHAGHYPSDDIARVGRYREEKDPTRTLVWIPAFLTHQSLDELGRLVLLDHVLSGNKLDEYGAHLSQLDREQARVILVNQRDQVRQRIRNFLLAAYGISTFNRDAIDSALDPGTYVHSLEPGLKLQPPVAATLRDALESLFEQALRHQHPAHPEFRGEVRPKGLQTVLKVVRRAVEASDRRVDVDKADREDVYRIAEPLGLGQMGEAHFVLGDEWVRDFEQKRAQDGVSEITVKRVREWINRPQARGMPTDVENLVILTFALQTNRTFLLYGGMVEPTLDRMQNELELREEALPDEDAWREAVERASVILGVTVMPLRSAGNVARLAEQAKAVADAETQQRLGRYVALLKERIARLDPGEADVPRLRTAQAAHALVTAVGSARREGVVDAIAEAEVATSAAAMAAARARAADLCTALERTQWELLSGNAGLPEPFSARADATLLRVREALRSDEHVTPLAPALRQAEADALALLQQAARVPAPPPAEPAPQPHPQPAPGPQPPQPEPRPTVTHAGGQKRVRGAEVDQVLTELQREADAAPDAWINVTWEIEPG